MIRQLLYGALDFKAQMEELDRQEEALVSKLKDKNSVFDIDDYYYGNKDLLIDFQSEVKIPSNIEEAWLMTHDEYVIYLFNKYGHPTCDYFRQGDKYKTKNMNVERLTEGLFLHHLAEECRITFNALVDKEFAKKRHHNLYTAKNFIYCNYIEHLLLHIKIAIDDFNEPQGSGIDINGAKKIWRELNKYYTNQKVLLQNKKAAELVQGQYNDYIYIMKQVLHLIRSNTPFAQYCTEDELITDDIGMICPGIRTDLEI